MRICLEDPVTGESTAPRRISRALLVYSVSALLVFWPVAVVVLLRAKALGLAISFFLAGLQGPLLIRYALVRADRKQWWRWIVLVSGGLGILMFSLIDAVNLDIDGFFELLILGTMGPAIGHTMATTIVGPLIFGRALCGWGCWRAMVLERLPVGTGSGRLKGVWTWTPLIGVIVSLAAAVLFALVPGNPHGSGIWPVAGGVAVYYTAAITMALALRDQRAFCKYLCPAGFILRWTSRPALLRISADAGACNECEECTNVCPMDIPVVERVKEGVSIGRGDCILCQRCVESCPTGALKTILRI